MILCRFWFYEVCNTSYTMGRLEDRINVIKGITRESICKMYMTVLTYCCNGNDVVATIQLLTSSSALIVRV